MVVKTIEEAWRKAGELMPCSTRYDSERSARAGYTIYSSTDAETPCYVCELGDRLEVNLPNGKSVNIWIEEQPTAAQEAVREAEVAEYLADEDAIRNGKYEACYAPEVGQLITIIIDGDPYAAKSERAVYEALKHDHANAAISIIEQWCNQHGLAWGTISRSQNFYIDHGNGSGHFIVSGFVSARIGHEAEFLASCAALLCEKMNG